MLACVGCGGATPAAGLAQAPAFEPEDQTKCKVRKSQTRPLIVEWPSADRAALEAIAKRGLVLVRYEGCEMEILAQCSTEGEYAYTAITRKDDRISIKTEDDLWANVPLGAAALESKLAKAGELNVGMSRWSGDTRPRSETYRSASWRVAATKRRTSSMR